MAAAVFPLVIQGITLLPSLLDTVEKIITIAKANPSPETDAALAGMGPRLRGMADNVEAAPLPNKR